MPYNRRGVQHCCHCSIRSTVSNYEAAKRTVKNDAEDANDGEYGK